MPPMHAPMPINGMAPTSPASSRRISTSLKRMYDIVKAVGGATKDPPEGTFDPEPYTRSKRTK